MVRHPEACGNSLQKMAGDVNSYTIMEVGYDDEAI
jgi:hypothetical protein